MLGCVASSKPLKFRSKSEPGFFESFGASVSACQGTLARRERTFTLWAESQLLWLFLCVKSEKEKGKTL